MSLRRETTDALRSLGLRPRRRLGQSFLVDPAFADRIVAAAGPAARNVLEIGPGLGALSTRLAASAAALVLVEIDETLAGWLERRFEREPRVRVVRGDALTIDLDEMLPPGGRSLVVANLPYSVGSQILLRLLEEQRRFDRLVLMLQREVAARLTAPPGTRDYGLLSIWTSLYGEPRTLFHVPPGTFLPRPKVESTVVEIALRDAPRVVPSDPARFGRIVRASFAQRRKMLRSALRGIVDAAAFERAGIDSGRRGETLSVEEFARLAEGRTRHAGAA